MNRAPMDIEIFGPFLSMSVPAGHAKKITNIPMSDNNRCDCQLGIENDPSKVFSIGDNANQFAPYAKITNQKIPTTAQRYP
jgi:hypothetical protein